MLTKTLKISLLSLLIVSCVSHKPMSVEEAYHQAKTFTSPNNNGLVSETKLWNLKLYPNSDSFSFDYYPQNAYRQHMFFDGKTGTFEPMFDHPALANALKKISNKKIDSKWLKIDKPMLAGDNVTFTYEKKQYKFSRTNRSLEEVNEVEKSEKDPNDLSQYSGWPSPDYKWEIIQKDYNLFLLNRETKDETQLTFDGEKDFAYGLTNESPADKIKHDKDQIGYWPYVQWSPDSTKFATYKADMRKMPITVFTLSSPKDGSVQKSYTGKFVYGGQKEAMKVTRYIFDINSKKSTKVNLPTEDSTNWGVASMVHWLKDSSAFYLRVQNRGRTRIDLVKVDSQTGEPQTLIEQTSNTGIPEQLGYYRFNKNMDKCFLVREDDGWAHIYLHDLNKFTAPFQVTRGEWAVKKIIRVDEEKQQIYFIATGKEPNVNPYLSYAYRVNFDGSNLILLTPEHGDHSITFTANGNYIIDTYSLVNDPGKTFLKTTDGKVVKQLLDGACVKLLAKGFTLPENFVAKGRDGKTDIWGTVFRPANFDADKKYPVIESIYPGPHNSWANTNFSAYFSREISLAQLGFIVVKINGMGSANRSKAFRDVSYRNLKDAGFPDRIAWMKALAKKYPYIDLDRVGITGHSAGGYASVRAMLDYPDFYKVCVSSAGNHDNRLGGSAGWAEVWMGFPENEGYNRCSNITDAHKLEGELLLMHGEIDDNVPVTTTMRLASELNKHGKKYRMLIAPNQTHELDEFYWKRARWDFFVEHLLGQEPPRNYKFKLEKPKKK